MADIPDLKRAYDALVAKNLPYTVFFDYYDGRAPVKYVADRLYQIFGDKFARFTQNWSAIVIDSEMDRIHLNQFTVSSRAGVKEAVQNDAATDALNEVFIETELNLDANEVHRSALVCGESFVFVWRNAEGNIEAYYNDPRLCHVFYDDENPRKPTVACKWWVGTDERRYLNLYYPDRIEYFVSTGKAEAVSAASAFMPYIDEGNSTSVADNPFGEIPIFHFRPERRTLKSQLVNVIEPQDGINKLFSDMMVAAEFGAGPQRWAILNGTVKNLKNAPNEIWDLPAGDGLGQDTQVGQFAPTDLANYLQAMEKLAQTIATITRTPRHYFFGMGGDPSGEALIAMETPLNKKTNGHIDQFKPIWQRIGAFLLKLSGMEVAAKDIDPGFDAPETVQPKMSMEIVQTGTQSGIPLETMLRREGWSQKEIDQMRQDAERKADIGGQADGTALTNADVSASADTLRRLGIDDLLRNATESAAPPSRPDAALSTA